MAAHTQVHPAQVALRRIVDRVSAIIPPDFKGDEYWRITVRAHDAFIDAVRECEQNDSQETRARVVRTGEAWLNSWRQAVRQWRRDRHRARQEAAR